MKDSEGFERYKELMDEIKAGIRTYKENCANFNSEINVRDGPSCWDAREGLIRYSKRVEKWI